VSAPAVIVPAHNESTVIDRCLRSVSAAAYGLPVEIVVVCNGCTDNTADIARAAGATVLELDEPGKARALNAGDAAVAGFPRIYLDADVELSASAIRSLAAVLAGSRPLVAAPGLVVDVQGCSWLVKAFYRVFSRLPYLSSGLVGAGCYALNASARARFGNFPDITADDLFVQGLFDASERAVAPDATFTTRAPRTLRGLIAVRTRTYAGNAEAARMGLAGAMEGSTASSMRALGQVVARRPWLLIDAAVYVVVNTWARRRSRTSTSRWERDDSSR
jgi:glycosyltransferase involved in cell wall biosynthesis